MHFWLISTLNDFWIHIWYKIIWFYRLWTKSQEFIQFLSIHVILVYYLIDDWMTTFFNEFCVFSLIFWWIWCKKQVIHGIEGKGRAKRAYIESIYLFVITIAIIVLLEFVLKYLSLCCDDCYAHSLHVWPVLCHILCNELNLWLRAKHFNVSLIIFLSILFSIIVYWLSYAYQCYEWCLIWCCAL